MRSYQERPLVTPLLSFSALCRRHCHHSRDSPCHDRFHVSTHTVPTILTVCTCSSAAQNWCTLLCIQDCERTQLKMDSNFSHTENTFHIIPHARSWRFATKSTFSNKQLGFFETILIKYLRQKSEHLDHVLWLICRQ